MKFSEKQGIGNAKANLLEHTLSMYHLNLFSN